MGQMDEKFKKQFPTRKELEIVSSTREWKKLDTAARCIQKFYRIYIRYGQMHPQVLQDLYLVGTDAARSSTESLLGKDRCIQKFYRIYIR